MQGGWAGLKGLVGRIWPVDRIWPAPGPEITAEAVVRKGELGLIHSLLTCRVRLAWFNGL